MTLQYVTLPLIGRLDISINMILLTMVWYKINFNLFIVGVGRMMSEKACNILKAKF